MKPTTNLSKPPLPQVKPIKDVLDNIMANKKESLLKSSVPTKSNLVNRKTPIEPLKDSRDLRAKRTGSSKELDTKQPVGLLGFHSETLNNRKPQMNLRYNFSPVRGSNQKEIMFQDSTNKPANRGANSGASAARKNNKIFVDNAQSNLTNKPFTYKISPKHQASHQIKLEKEGGLQKIAAGGGADNYHKKAVPAFSKGDFYARKDNSAERQNTSPRREKNPSLNVQKMNLSSPLSKTIKSRYQKEGVEAKPVLVLLDHDLGFIRDYLICFDAPCNFICEKLYSFDYENHQSPVVIESQEKKGKLSGYAGVFIFIKFSPRVKSSSLKMLQKLVNNEECLFVVKCLLAVESVDLNLDYECESMTIERKKKIEYNLFLEKQTFDAYSIGYQEVSRLEQFFKIKLNLSE